MSYIKPVNILAVFQKIKRQPITVRALQTEVLKKGEILVRYFISPDKLYVFLISKESFKVVPLTAKENEIKRIVKNYLLALGENSSRGINRYGKTLYQKLFKPLENTIKENNDIIIIPDGELAKVPFESFIIDKEKSGRWYNETAAPQRRRGQVHWPAL